MQIIFTVGSLKKHTYLRSDNDKLINNKYRKMKDNRKIQHNYFLTLNIIQQNPSDFQLIISQDFKYGEKLIKCQDLKKQNVMVNNLKIKKYSFILGKFVASSCVFGIGDVQRLIKRPELIAHKMYLDFEPAG